MKKQKKIQPIKIEEAKPEKLYASYGQYIHRSTTHWSGAVLHHP